MSKQQNISANVQRGLCVFFFFFSDFVEVWDWGVGCNGRLLA